MSALYRYLLGLFLPVALIPVLLLSVAVSWELARTRRAERQELLRARLEVGRRLLLPALPPEGRATPRVARLLDLLAGEGERVHLALIRADGAVVAETAAPMENQATQPEVREALLAGEAFAERESPTLGARMLYLALRLDRNGRPWGVLRGAVPLHPLRSEPAPLRWSLALGLALGIAAALVLAARFARHLAAPLDALSEAVRDLQEGRWSLVHIHSGPERLQELAQDVNRMIERLRRLVQETETGRAQLETILGQMQDGLLVLDGEGALLRANAAALRLLEFEPEGAAGAPLLALVPSYPLDAVARQALAGGHPAPVELRSPRSGHALRILASPLMPEGRPDGAVLLVQDLTEIRRVDQMRRDFVANIGHELKTPIAAIRALAETLVLRGGRRPEIAGDYAERISREAERLGALVESLLELSRIESGKREFRLEALEAAPLVEEVVERFRARAEARRIRLELDGAPGAVRADREALHTLLGNILDNALKYTPPGGRVRVALRPAGQEFRFVVEDTGPGIPPEDLPRIFERFYRVDRARSKEVEGTGLGLAIVKHLCEQQGGRVWVESEPGRGARFHVALPAAPAGNPPLPAETAAERPLLPADAPARRP